MRVPRLSLTGRVGRANGARRVVVAPRALCRPVALGGVTGGPRPGPTDAAASEVAATGAAIGASDGVVAPLLDEELAADDESDPAGADAVEEDPDEPSAPEGVTIVRSDAAGWANARVTGADDSASMPRSKRPSRSAEAGTAKLTDFPSAAAFPVMQAVSR